MCATAVIVALAGCSSSAGVEADSGASAAVKGVTLAQSKSYAQLLRNEASSRLPPIVLKTVENTSDSSVACDTAAADPSGLVRSWQSSTSILVTNSTSSRIQSVTDDLVATFVAQGWAAKNTEASTTDISVIDLSSAKSLAGIEITTTQKTDAQVPSILITTTGACALTAGPKSDEVKVLEAQDAITP